MNNIILIVLCDVLLKCLSLKTGELLLEMSYGFPRRVVLDRAVQFIAWFWKPFCKPCRVGVEGHHSSMFSFLYSRGNSHHPIRCWWILAYGTFCVPQRLLKWVTNRKSLWCETSSRQVYPGPSFHVSTMKMIWESSLGHLRICVCL